jgi:hypothetical protein
MSPTERTALANANASAAHTKLGGPGPSSASSRPDSRQSDYGAVRRNYTQELDGASVEDDGKAPAGAVAAQRKCRSPLTMFYQAEA